MQSVVKVIMPRPTVAIVCPREFKFTDHEASIERPVLGEVAVALEVGNHAQHEEQLLALGRPAFDWIVVADGSGGTQAGLTAGLHLHAPFCNVHGVAVCDDAEWFRRKVLADLSDWRTRAGSTLDLEALRIHTLDGYIGPGYGVADAATLGTIGRAARTEGLLLDFSRQRLDERVLASLLELAEQTEVPRWIELMFSGFPINNTEDRPALHVALRRPSDQPLTAEGENVMPLVEAERSKMRALAEALHAGKLLGYTGQPITDVVNIGIGGSDLGIVMAVTAPSGLNSRSTISCWNGCFLTAFSLMVMPRPGLVFGRTMRPCFSTVKPSCTTSARQGTSLWTVSQMM